MKMTSQEIVSVYEAMVVLTEQMLAAAQASDWDALVVLEQRCAAYVRQLKEADPPVALDRANRERKVEAIRKMLDDDRKIRDLTMPWMARLSAMINHAGTERRLASAYGT
jgi:flagellar protein FliT